MVSDTQKTQLDPEDECEKIELPAYPPTNWWGRAYQKIEGKLSNLCFNNNFWYKILTTIYLPLAAKSKMMLGKQVGEVYETTLPFKRFNKNWYDAMAGAALLANTEVAGGMAIFKQVGEKYTVVCKEMHYKFRLPCNTDAIYRVKVLEDVKKLMRTKPEFNVPMQIDVMAEIKNKMRKIGSSTITFHVAAKSLMAQRIYKAKQKSLAKE